MSSQPERPRMSLQSLDYIEKLFLLTLYAAFLVRILAALRPTHFVSDLIVNVPVLMGEALVIGFALFRRKTEDISSYSRDWFLALTATCLPLLVGPQPGSQLSLPAWLYFGGMVAAIGFQLYAKFTLGRSFGLVAANRGLRLSGPYRLVRHPIYLGYLMMHVTYFLGNPTLRNFCIYAFFYALQIPRIGAEERLLTQNPEYLEYCKRVKYRLIPRIY